MEGFFAALATSEYNGVDFDFVADSLKRVERRRGVCEDIVLQWNFGGVDPY